MLIGHTALLRELYTLAADVLLSFDPLAASLTGKKQVSVYCVQKTFMLILLQPISLL
jgi:hypothetical protein